MRYEIGFGLGFDKDNNPIDPIDRQEKLKIVLTEATIHFGGANLVFGQGAWLNRDGALVVEESATLIIQSLPTGRLFTDEDASAKLVAKFVRRLFNQAAVILTKHVATSSLVEV